MTIKFSKTEEFKNAKTALTDAMSANDEIKTGEALNSYLDVLQTEVTKAVSEQVNNEMLDRSILQQRGTNVLTSEETKFFNRVVSDGGFTDDAILPITTQERIFDDLVKEHALINAIGVQDLGPVTRFITADPTKAYAWGPLFGDIAGQVNAAFSEEDMGTFKLTSFAAIPNDMIELGPVWLERYVRTLLVESYSTGLEFGFVTGGGATVNQPVGLNKNVAVDTGAVTAKTTSGTLTFAPSQFGEVVAGELHGVLSALSTNEAGDARTILNRVIMVVNPIDYIAVTMRNTIQTANGQWVSALPYNVQLVESEVVTPGEALFFIRGEYLAAVAGGYRFKKFDQTLALEDATLYTIKQFANGKPKDNKTALLYTLDIDFAPPVV
jgi:HK97 family phage major capsid protein